MPARSSASVVSSLSLQTAVTAGALKTGMPQCSSTCSTASPRDWLTLRHSTASYSRQRSSGCARSSSRRPSSMISKSMPRRCRASTSNFSSTRTREARIATRIVLFSPIFFNPGCQRHLGLLDVQHLQFRVTVRAVEHLSDQQALEIEFCLTFWTLCYLCHVSFPPSLCCLHVFYNHQPANKKRPSHLLACDKRSTKSAILLSRYHLHSLAPLRASISGKHTGTSASLPPAARSRLAT